MIQQTLYVSGAITGMPDLNRQKFAEATKRLRGMGHIVINPHEICEGLTADEWETCMRRCIAKLTEAHVLILLDDWKQSRGAKIECDVAVKIGINIINYNDFLKWNSHAKN